MKKLGVFLFSTLLAFSSCGTKKSVETDPNYLGVEISSMKFEKPDTLVISQLDSLTTADQLPSYSKWEKTYVKDSESNKAYEFATIYDKSTGIIYTVKYLKDEQKYVVQKKKTTSVK